jgi:hypothetical protein
LASWKPALILAVLALGGALPGTASATFPGSTGDMVFQSYVGDPFDPDDIPRQVLPNADIFSSPRWSPDGTKIVYQRHAINHAIWVVNADGTGAHAITNPDNDYDYDSEPAWSADGKEIYFSRLHSTIDDQYSQLRRTSAETGGDGVEVDQVDGILRNIEAQPGGRRVVAEIEYPNDGTDNHPFEVRIYDKDGGQGFAVHSYRHSVQYVGLRPDGRRVSWSPDGKRLAIAEMFGHEIVMLGEEGNRLGQIALSDGKRIGGFTFTPDGAHLLVGACGEIERSLPDDSCDQRLVLAAPDDADIDPDEPREIPLPGPGPDTGGFFKPDFQPADLPVILIPGFLGTEMECSLGKLWPNTNPVALDNMHLNRAGTGNAPGTCGAKPTKLLESASIVDVYGPMKKQLEKLLEDPNDPRTRGRVHPFAWDWRLDPRPQLSKLNDLISQALSDDLSQKQALDEVILVAHSAGGLVARAALDNSDIRKRIRRVLTMGTPYLGAPKTFFPLLAGVLEPGDITSGFLDAFAVQRFARTLTGAFILYPSDQYGRWLRKAGAARDLTPAETRQYLQHGLHASAGALGVGFSFKSSIASGFKKLEPAGLREFRVLAGTGLPTVDHISLVKGGKEVGINYATGDKTVALHSATQTAAGGGRLGDPVRISYVCFLDHMALMQNDETYDVMGDFIRYGSPPRKTKTCDFKGFEYSLRTLGGTTAGGSRKRARAPSTPVGGRALKSLGKAELKGVLDVIPLRGETLIVTGRGFEGSTAFRVRRALITASRLGSGGSHKPVTYGPLTGKLSLKPLRNGKVQVKLNGHKLKRRHRARKR